MQSAGSSVVKEPWVRHGAVLVFSLLMLIAAADATIVKVDPPQQVVQLREPFTITVQVEDVMNMGADQAFVLFEPTAIQVTAIHLGPFLKSGGSTLPITSIDNANGTAYFAEALLSGGVSGSGVLATIECTTIAAQAGTFPFTLANVVVVNGSGIVIPAETLNGTVTLNSQSAFVISINSPQHKRYASTSIRLEFTIEPANATPIWIAYKLDNAENVIISGNTTIQNLPAGEHGILLYALDNNDNIAQSNTVFFTVHTGDIVGDGEVDIFDLQRLAWAFLAQPTDTSWNAAADLNCDDTVNVVDLQLLAWNFGNEYTL